MQTRPRSAGILALALALALALVLQPVAAHLGVEPVDTVVGSALPCADPALGYERGCETWTDAYVGIGHGDEQATSIATGGGLVLAAGLVEPSDLLLAAYGVDGGAPLWTVRDADLGYVQPRAAVRADGALAAVAASGGGRTVVLAFAADGTPVWNASEAEASDAVALLAAGDGFVLVRNLYPTGFGRTAVVRFAGDGSVAWRATLEGVKTSVLARDAALSADGARLAVVGAADGDAQVAVLDAANGAVLWARTWDVALGEDAAETVAIGTSSVVVGATTFPSGGDDEPVASVHSFARGDGTPAWSHTFAAPANGSTTAAAVAVAADGTVAFAVVNLSDPWWGDVSGDWVLGYAADGTPLWARELPAPSWNGIPERFLAPTASGFALARTVDYGSDTELRVLDASAGTDVSVALWAGPGYYGQLAEAAFDAGRAFFGGALAVGWSERDLLVLAWDVGAAAPAWSATHDTPAATAADHAAGNALSADGARLYTALTTDGDDRSRDVLVRALDAATGAVVWESRYAGAAGASEGAYSVHVAGDDVVIVVGTAWDGSPNLLLLAYEGATGGLLWSQATPLAYSTYVDATGVSGDLLAVGLVRWINHADSELEILALSAEDGAALWSTTWNLTGALEESAYALAVTSDAVAVAGLGYVGGWQSVGFAAAFDAANGALRWERLLGTSLRSVAPLGSSVVVAGARGQDALVAAFASDGTPVWNATVDRRATESFAGVVASPDGTVVHAAGATASKLLVAAFDADDGAVRHVRANDVFPTWPGAAALAISADGSRLATVSGGSELVTTVLDAADGKMLAASIVQDGYAVPRGVAVTGDTAFTTATIRRDGTGYDAVTVAYAADDANALPWWTLT